MIKRILTIVALAVAAFLGFGLMASPASAAVANSPANARACWSVEDFHYLDHHYALSNPRLVGTAYRYAQADAAKASPALKAAIQAYLRTDRGWARVQTDCAPVTYGQ